MESILYCVVGIARAKLGRLPSAAHDAESRSAVAFHAFYRAAASDRFPGMENRDSLWLSLLLVTSGKVLDAKRRELCQKTHAGKLEFSAIIRD